MLRRFATLIAVVAMTVVGFASSNDNRVANAAMIGDVETVRGLLRQAADVNAAQSDGMTALHWAAQKGNPDLTRILLTAGANIRATTRVGAYTPLYLAARSGAASVAEILLKAGSNPNAKAASNMTSLMVAAMAGDARTVQLLVEHGADLNARESEHGQTPAMLAAALDRPAAIIELAKKGADLNLVSTVRPPAEPGRGAPVPPNPAPPTTTQAAPPAAPVQRPNDLRGGGNPRGGFTALMYAARDGSVGAARSLVEAGANLNALAGDKSTAVLIATINGRFDLAKYFVEHGADLNIASMDGATPLYGVIRTQWSRQSFRPQPSIKQERIGYMELLKLMLENGADPNERLTKALWYSSYGYVYASASEIGTTPFWKCAEVADIDCMKLLLSYGADPTISNKDGVTALLIASGAGSHGNDDVLSAYGRFAAVKYLVEELKFDLNAADNGNSYRGENLAAPIPPAASGQQPPQPQPGDGYTALHNAASRGDNEMILYLVSKGANVNAATKTGVTVVDMANGPRQRVQPFRETIALLEMLGAKNSYKCISC